jgi:CheY-like chemotaxis protein
MEETTQATSKHRVLVIDDNSDMAEITSTILEIMGHETRWSSSGKEGLVEAARFAPDIVFLDLAMPELDGYEVARRLRAEFGDRPMHLVALTGWNTPDHIAQAIAGGFDDYLLKPVDVSALESVMSRTVPSPGPRPEAAAAR